MKSPFPGMDPYLENHWGDVHSRLVLYYKESPEPPLQAIDAEWANSWLRKARK